MKTNKVSKFWNLSYEDILLLIEPDMFYLVVDKNNIYDFISAFCNVCAKKVGLNYNPNVQFEPFTVKSKGSQADSAIQLNEQYVNMFDLCKEHNLKSYPYDLASVIMHEVQHIKQYEKMKNCDIKSERDSFVCGGFSYFEDRVKKLNHIHNAPFGTTKKSRKAHNNLVEQWEETSNLIYGNSPHEIDSNMSSLAMLLDLYKISNSDDTLCAINTAVEDIDSAFERGEWNLSDVLNDSYCSDKTRGIFKKFIKKNPDVGVVRKKDVSHLFPEYEFATELPESKNFEEFLDDDDKFNRFFNDGYVSKGVMYDQLMELLNGK